MTAPETWRTDEPCPTCETGLTLTEDGGPVVRANCPLCGWAGPLDFGDFDHCFGGSNDHHHGGTQDQG